MGLGAVELLMDVEQRFGIEIPDAEAQHVDTPGKLIDLVHAKVGRGAGGKCVSQRSFYRVRRVLVAAMGIERGVIAPGTQLGSIIPLAQRRTRWPKVAGLLGVDPGLELPAWHMRALFLATATVAAGMFLRGDGVVVTALAAVACFLGGAVLSQRAAVLLPSSVGDLAREAVPRLLLEDQLQGRPTEWTRAEVAEVIRGIISVHTGTAAFPDNADFRSLDLN